MSTKKPNTSGNSNERAATNDNKAAACPCEACRCCDCGPSCACGTCRCCACE